MDPKRWWKVLPVVVASALVFLIHYLLIEKYGASVWAYSHDLKHYGALAKSFLRGDGLRIHDLHISMFSEASSNLHCYPFQILHSIFIALIMWLGKDTGFRSVLLSSAFYWMACIPLLFLVFRKYFSYWISLVLALVLVLNPRFADTGLTGMTEPLMFVWLFAVAACFLYIKKNTLSSVLCGALLGLLNLTRVTGIMLFPACLYLIGRQRGWKQGVFFTLAFSIPTLFGILHTHQGDLKFARFNNPAVEVGISEGFFTEDEITIASVVTSHWKGILQKAVTYSKQYLIDLNHLWSDYWVFIPAVLLFFLVNKSPGWAGFLSLSLLASYAAIVLYFYVPRVNTHVSVFAFFAAVFYLSRHDWEKKQVIFAGVGSLLLFLAFHTVGSKNILYFEFGLAILLLIAILKPSYRLAIFPFALSFFITIQIEYAYFSFSRYRKPARVAELLPFQQDLAKLKHRFIPKGTLLLSDRARDVAWFTEKTAFHLPKNIRSSLQFLERFRPNYVVLLTEEPHLVLAEELSANRFVRVDWKLPSLWIYELAPLNPPKTVM